MTGICDRCGGPLDEGYEIREYGRDEDGYADEEIICGNCAAPRTSLTIDADSRLTDIPNCLAFFRYPERVQIGRVHCVEAAQ